MSASNTPNFRAAGLRLAVLTLAWVLPSTLHAALFWDGGTVNVSGNGNGVSEGSAGIWDTTLLNWDAGTAPHVAWSNAANETAVFGGTAGAVALGSAITVGGLRVDSTGYALSTGGNTLTFGAASNVITLGAGTSTSITGSVGGANAVALANSNAVGAATGTLTLNGTSTGGWSGGTTVGPFATLALAQSNQALLNTAAITLNGGGITLTNADGTEGALDRVNNAAAITANGGTITYTNTSGTAVYAEAIGSVALSSGQTNIVLTNTQAGTGSQTLTLSGLTRPGTASTVFFASGGNLNATKNMLVVTGATATPAGQIIGPWATTGSSATNQTNFAVYNAAGQIVPSAIGSSAETAWTNAANAYTMTADQTLTATRTITALRNATSSGNRVITLGAFNLETYGVFTGPSTQAALTISGTGGVLTTPSGGGMLFLTAGVVQTGASGTHFAVNVPINDNGGPVTLVKSGGAILILGATSTGNYSGGTVLNAGSTSIQTDAQLGAASGGITFNGSAGISIALATTSTRAITINNGANASISNAASYTSSGLISGDGGIVKVNTGTWTISNAANTFTGGTAVKQGTLSINALKNFGTASSLGAPASGSIQLGDSSNTGTLNYTGAADSTNRTFQIGNSVAATTGGGTLTNSGTGALTFTAPFFNTPIADITATRVLTLSGANTGGSNQIQGVIQDNSATGVVGLTKSSTNTWILSGANTYTGVTTVSAGTLQIGNGGTTGSLAATGTIVTNSTLTFNRTNTVTQGIDFTAAAITGTGALTKSGVGGTLVLNVANTYAGGTTVSSGLLQVGVAGVGTTGTGTVQVNSAATLFGTGTVAGSSFTALSGSIIHTGDSTAAGTFGTLTFSPASGTGTFDFQSGSTVNLDVNAAGSADKLNFVGTGGQTLLFNGNLTVGPATMTPTAAKVYKLLDWSSLGSTPSFASRYIGASYTSGGFLKGNGDDSLGLNLPDISATAYVWDIRNFTTDGTIASVLVSSATGTMSASPNAPVIDGFDIANFEDQTASDKFWAEGNTSAGAAHGQTFRTGSAASYLRSVSYRTISSGSATPTKTYVVRIGKVSGEAFTLVRSETFTQTTNWNGLDYMTWTFATPVLLEGDTSYAVDVGMTTSTTSYTTGIPYLQVTANTYLGGQFYLSGSALPGTGTNTLTYSIEKDRVFHLDIGAPTGSALAFVAGNPPDNATAALLRPALIATFNQNITAGSGNVIVRDITNIASVNTTTIPMNDPRITISGNLLKIATSGLIQWGKKYAVRITSGAVLDASSNPYLGFIDDSTWSFTIAASDPLLAAIAALKAHINGTTVLTAAQIATHSQTLNNEIVRYGDNADNIAALFDLITTYETVVGPLWTVGGDLTRSAEADDMPWTIYRTMQGIMDQIYNGPVLAQNEALLTGFKFLGSSRFPGACPTPPVGQTNTVAINASFPDSFGRTTQMWNTAARRPTGSYLAPGTMVTVTVPPALVGQGYQIRVGCHSWDFSNRPTLKRLDRVSLLYDINSTDTKVANPLGGGVYIEVPKLANAGIVNVTITGAARSPFFSSTPHRSMTLSEWQTTERTQPGPWADFQSEKFMFQVPRSWIYAYADPITNMANWDKAIDAFTDLMGFPNIRGKETMYDQIDLLMRASVFAPGYPAVNSTYNTNTVYTGNQNHYLLTGPRNAPDYEFHEVGHAFFFPKYDTEQESTVNLPHVAIQTQKFGVSFDTALAQSNGYNSFCTLANTAVVWMTSFNFSPFEVPMDDWEKAYQPQGHAKFCDLARLYGWGGMNAFYFYYNDKDDKGQTYPTDIDSLTLQLCKSYGKDVRPMLHFWGIHPVNATTLNANIAALKLKVPVEIYDRIIQYKALIPANNAAFTTWCTSWWGGTLPLITGFGVEREHARQLTTTLQNGSAPQARFPNEQYNEAAAAQIHARVQEILDIYYPTGRPTDYAAWDANFPGVDLSDPNADADHDGMSNDEERIFGLDPTSADSSAPIAFSSTLKTTGNFTYTRRTSTLTNMTYTVWTSTDLVNWIQDTGATQTVSSTVANVQTVTVKISAGLYAGTRRFVRVQAVAP